MMAQLQEHIGDRVDALATYQSLVDLMAANGQTSYGMAGDARRAIKRLQGG